MWFLHLLSLILRGHMFLRHQSVVLIFCVFELNLYLPIAKSGPLKYLSTHIFSEISKYLEFIFLPRRFRNISILLMISHMAILASVRNTLHSILFHLALTNLWLLNFLPSIFILLPYFLFRRSLDLYFEISFSSFND